MSKIKRKFDLNEKLQILREGETNGVGLTCRKYQIARSLFYNWKNRFNHQGPDGLALRYYRANLTIKALEKEKERFSFTMKHTDVIL